MAGLSNNVSAPPSPKVAPPTQQPISPVKSPQAQAPTSPKRIDVYAEPGTPGKPTLGDVAYGVDVVRGQALAGRNGSRGIGPGTKSVAGFLGQHGVSALLGAGGATLGIVAVSHFVGFGWLHAVTPYLLIGAAAVGGLAVAAWVVKFFIAAVKARDGVQVNKGAGSLLDGVNAVRDDVEALAGDEPLTTSPVLVASAPPLQRA